MLYSDISPRTNAYADRRLLTRSVPNNILGQFGQVRELPSKSTKTMMFRRYNKLAAATAPIAEGVTPVASAITKTDLSVMIQQFGSWVMITDVIQDTHEDPVLRESVDILGEQAGETYDLLRAGVLKAGTNVTYSNGAARDAVQTCISVEVLKRIDRYLLRQEAKRMRSIVQAGPNISTRPIAEAYIVVCHCDLKYDLEAMTGWIPVQEYATQGGQIQGEIGAWGNFRFVIDNNLTAWADAGAAKLTMISTTGTYADIYPVLIFGRDAYGLVPLGGKNSVSTYVNNPKASDSDPLAQRGTCGWKGYHACVILNDLWMMRLECGCTA